MQPQTIHHDPPSPTSPSFPRRPRPRLMRRPRPMSQPVTNPVQPRPLYQTQIIPFTAIERIVQIGVWALCAASFLLSWLGNIAPFGADVRALLAGRLAYAALVWPALLAALGYQLVVQIAQFWAAGTYGRRSRHYRVWLCLSVLPAMWSYGEHVIPWAGSSHLWGDAWPVRIAAYAGSAVALFVALWFNDAWQERVLVRR